MARRSDIDLVLAVLCVVWPKGECLTIVDLADLCEVDKNSIWVIENRAKRKLREALAPRIHELLPD